MKYQVVKSTVLQGSPGSLFRVCFVDYSGSSLGQVDRVVNVSLCGLGLSPHCAASWLRDLGQVLKLLSFLVAGWEL